MHYLPEGYADHLMLQVKRIAVTCGGSEQPQYMKGRDEMVKGIPANVPPDLVKCLMEMGHGDEIVAPCLFDGN